MKINIDSYNRTLDAYFARPKFNTWSRTEEGKTARARDISRIASWILGGAIVGGIAWIFGRVAGKIHTLWKGRVAANPTIPTTPITDAVHPIFTHNKRTQTPPDGIDDIASEVSSESDYDSDDESVVDVIIDTGIKKTPTKEKTVTNSPTNVSPTSTTSTPTQEVEATTHMMGIPNVGNTCWLNSCLKFIATTDHYDKFLELDLEKEGGSKSLFTAQELKTLVPLHKTFVNVINTLRHGEGKDLDRKLLAKLIDNIKKANIFLNDGELKTAQKPGKDHLDAIEFMAQLL